MSEPGSQYSPAPELYNKFWKKVNEWTQSRPMNEAERKANEAARGAASLKTVLENIGTIREFLDDLGKVMDAAGDAVDLSRLRDFVRKLNRGLTIIETVGGASQDAVIAAQEVQTDLSSWYREAYAKCKAESGSDYAGDTEFICLAAIDRQWQGRNVKHILGAQDGSFIRRVYEKWKDRLKALVIP